MPNLDEENYLDNLISEASGEEEKELEPLKIEDDNNDSSEMESVMAALTESIDADPVSSLLSGESGFDSTLDEQLIASEFSELLIDEPVEDAKIDFDLNEPILSDDDMARLASMDLDNIISDAKEETMSVEELFSDELSNSLDIAEGNSNKLNQAPAEVDIKLDNLTESAEDMSNLSVEETVKNEESKQEDTLVSQDLEMLNADEMANDADEELSDKHQKKKAKSKKGIFKVIKNVFFEEVEEAPISKEEIEAEAAKHVQESPIISKSEGHDLDENEKLINDMYGDNANLEENVAPKKGIFAKLKYRLQQLKEKNAREDLLEQEAEEKEYEKQQQAKADKKIAAEEKKAASKEKKEADKKKKAEEKSKKAAVEKPKKEKKPKPQPKPEDILKIKPKSMVLFIMFVVGVILLIVMINNTINYGGAISSAKIHIGNNNYSGAYRELAGMDLDEDDKKIFEQASVVMYVERHYESYENYSSMRMHTEAINALIKGVERYEHFYSHGAELGMAEQMNKSKQKIMEALKNDYGISEETVYRLVDMMDTNFVQYYKTIETYGKVVR